MVYVYRPSAFTGSARSPDIVFNRKKVGTAVNGSFFFFEAEPGAAKFVQKNFAGEQAGEFDVQLKSGQTYFLRLDLGVPTLKQSIGANGKTGGQACPFQGLDITVRGQDAELVADMDKRAQSSTCWPGFMFVSEERAQYELSGTKLSK